MSQHHFHQGSPSTTLRRQTTASAGANNKAASVSLFPPNTPPAKMTKQSAPPSLVSRNILIDRYVAIEQDSKKYEQHYQKSSTNTASHTATCCEREKTQRKLIKDPALQRKKVNAEVPKQVSVGNTGRDLTLLSMVQQLDMNVCGTDHCAMHLSAARNQHVTDLVDHSRTSLRWEKNPFIVASSQEQDNNNNYAKKPITSSVGGLLYGDNNNNNNQPSSYITGSRAYFGERKNSPPAVDEKMIRSGVAHVAPSDIAKAKRAGALESRLRRKFQLLMEDEKRQFQAELNRTGQNHRDEDLINDLTDENRHLKPVILNREASWQRLVIMGVFASELKGQIEEVKATNLLRRVFARELVRYLRRKRIVHEKNLFEQKMAVASFGANQQPSIGLMLRCFPVLRLDPEGYCSPSVMLAAALASKRGVPLAKALATFSSSLISGSSSSPVAKNNKNNNDDEDDEDDEEDDHRFPARKNSNNNRQQQQQIPKSRLTNSSSTLNGMSHLRISPEHLNLLASCFKRNVFRKNEPICWSPPPIYGNKNNNNNNNTNNNNNSWDTTTSGGNKINNKNSLLDTDWWNECDSQIHLIQSGIVRVIYRNQRREKSQALLLQQLSQQTQQNISSTSKVTTKSTHTKLLNNKNIPKKSIAEGGAASSSSPSSFPQQTSDELSSFNSRESLRSSLSGVETLSTGKILGLEALVPEQAKRYIAIADSDVATWSAPVRALMDALIHINPFGDPDAAGNENNNNNNNFNNNNEIQIRRGGMGNNKNNNNNHNNSSSATTNTTTTTIISSSGFGSSNSEQQLLLQQKVEKESVMMLGKLMQRMVLLRKQEIFMVQTPPTPIFLRSCAPLLYTWSDGGLTELCRSLSAVFVEKGNVVPLRKIASSKNSNNNCSNNNSNKNSNNDGSSSSHNWFFVGGTAQVPAEIIIPSTTAPPSHVDYVYFVIHGAVSIMGRKIYLNNANNNNTQPDNNNTADALAGSPTSVNGIKSSSSSSSRQKLVLLDNMKPGQSFGVASCLLGTLLDTAVPGAIASSLSAAGTPVEKFNSNNNNINAAVGGGAATNSSSSASNPINQTPAARQFFANGQHVSQSAGLVTAHSSASNIAQSQLSHLVGIELHATQDSVLWRLEKNVLMHVLAHEHIGTLLSPFGLYQQLGKPPGQ